MADPVFAFRGPVAPWNEPDVRDCRCECCGATWEQHINPDGKEKCTTCQGEGWIIVAETENDDEPQYAVCPAGCIEGIVKTQCTREGCDCTRFVEQDASDAFTFRLSHRVHA